MSDQLSADQIRRYALTRGGDRSWLSFLRSQQVAERVAATVRQRLAAAGVSLTDRLVTVDQSPLSPGRGTWRVVMHYPGIRLSSLAPRAAEINARRLQVAHAALSGAYTDADLLQSWTEPALAPRRRQQ